MYSNCCCSCWFEPEIIKIGQSSHKMYSNNILNFQESTTTLNACTKNIWKRIECTTYIYIYPTKQQLSGNLPPITKTIQVRQTRHTGHCWRSKDELISDILLWIPSHGRAKTGRPARTYIQQICADTGYSLEDLPGATDDRNGWRERVRAARHDDDNDDIYKQDLALNNLQWLICHKTKPNQIKSLTMMSLSRKFVTMPQRYSLT